jgi:hypothetical protein
MTSKVAAPGYAPPHEIFGFRTHKPEVNIVVVCDVEKMNARNRATTTFTNASGNPERAGAGIFANTNMTCRCSASKRTRVNAAWKRSGGENHLSRPVLYPTSVALRVAGGEHE